MITATGALTHVKKAFYYIENLSECDHGLYCSTKKTIKDMMDICSDIIEIGEDILKEDSSGRKGSEAHDNNKMKDMDDRISRIEDMMETLLHTVGEMKQDGANTTTPVTVPDTGRKRDKPKESDMSIIEAKTRRNKSKMSRMALDFSDGSREAAKSYEEGKLSADSARLSNVLHEWFQERFVQLNTAKSEFRYHISSIPKYVAAIFVDYFNAFDKSQWLSDFTSWINRLKNGDPQIQNYALPFNVFQTYTAVKSGQFNVSENYKDQCSSCWKELWPYMLCTLTKADTSYSQNFMSNSLV